MFVLALVFVNSLYLKGQCSFNIDNPNPCGATEIHFSVDNPVDTITYTWDLDGDGNIDTTGTSFSHVYPTNNNDQIYGAVLYANGDSCASLDVSVAVTPDPSIGVPPGIVVLDGNELKVCNGSGSFDLEIFNASTTFTSNASYTINWGDGSPPEDYDNTTFSNTNTISHTYVGLGYFTIFVTATSNNGCVFTNNYTFYNGGNPSVGIVIPGNTVGLCAPATLNFPITNAESNPPGTEYVIFINGEEVANFTQENLPPAFAYTFEESSCGRTTSTGNYNNAFDLRIVASNPCNSSTATIEPIEISEPPDPQFAIVPPPISCAGGIYTFENNTTNINEVISGNPSECIDVLNPSWTISGTAGEDWVIVNGNLFGSNQIDIEFLTPGVYTIEMTVISFSCGPYTISQTITIYEPPNVSVAPISIDVGTGGDCVPIRIPIDNQSAGQLLEYNWEISPQEGWTFQDSTNASSANPVIDILTGGTYNIQLTVSNPCAEITWDTTLLFPGPPKIDLAPIPDFCSSAILNFDSLNVSFTDHGRPINQYSWRFTGANQDVILDPYPTNIQYDSAGTYIVELQVENDCGISITQDTFVVQEATGLTLPAPLTICASEAPIRLEASPNGGEWSGTGVSANGRFNPASATLGINTLTYSYGVGACFMQDQMEITVIPAPSVDAGPDLQVCSNNAPIQLNGSPGNGTWIQADGTAIPNATFDPNQSGPGRYTFLYTVTGGNSCSDSDSLSIVVDPAPEILVSDSSYCNTPGTVSLPVANPTGGIWSGPGVTNPNGTFDPILAGGPGGYQLTYAFNGSNGCSTTQTINIGVIDPTNVDAGPDATLCASDAPYNLSQLANPPGGRWVTTSGGLTGNEFDPGMAGEGIHQFRYLIGSGNCAVEDALQIEVIDLGEVSAGPTQNLCEAANPIQLTGNSPNGGSWSGPGITNSQNGTFNPNLLTAGNYTVTYTVTDANTGCQKEALREIIIHPTPIAQFNVPSLQCTGSDFQIENLSTGATSLNWDFGDGNVSSEVNPTHAYDRTGTFNITLSISSGAGCTSQNQQSVEVATIPTPAFQPSLEEGCGNVEIDITNQSTGYQPTFLWNFGNGQTSTELQPNQPINYSPGVEDTTYIISLQVSNLCGDAAIQDTILVRPLPMADFGFTVDTGCAPLQVFFSNISLGSLDSYAWDFGNGLTSTDSLPEPQLFEADTIPIIYPIQLTVSNVCGSDTRTRDLVIQPERVNSFFNTSNTQGCAPFTVDFTNFSTLGTFISWDFGDGNQLSVDNPTYTFQEAGQYTVTQYASNSCASDSSTIFIEVLPSPEVSFTYPASLCKDQVIEFTNTSIGLAGSIWDFGTGDTSDLANPVYQFRETGVFTVSLTGIAPNTGCRTTISQDIPIGTPPLPAFDMPVANGCIPLTIQFTNRSTGGTYYQWDFGDGNSSVASNPEHTYLEAGDYEVNLKVSDENGCTSDTTYTYIFAHPLPEANFEIEKAQNCGLPVNVTFNNRSTGAEGFTWDLGEGLGSNFVSPQQEYTESGIRNISLLASNQFGCTDRMEKQLELIDQPIAEFSIDSMIGCEPLNVSFTNDSYGDHYFWDFGDGTTSAEIQPTHLYTQAGNYPVKLRVSFEEKCFDSLLIPSLVEVLERPIANFDWAEEVIGQPTGVIQFNNLSENGDQFYWDFGDGTTSNEVSPSHRYWRNDAWEVYLAALSENGCRDDTLMLVQPDFIKGLFVPNAFSPNLGLGEVKYFLPKGIGLKEYRLQIFSPYGELLWESTELSEGQPAEGWDGTHNGHPLPQDVYVWKVQGVFKDGTEWRGMVSKDGKLRSMGSVTLLR